MTKPFAESCEENKFPILQVLETEFKNKTHVLEIGSGTGQHAVFFSERLPHLRWQPSDRAENLAGIQAWRRETQATNLLPPLALDVSSNHWPEQHYDAVFSANTTHIMHWEEVEKLFAGVARLMTPDACFCLYGPFNYQGRFTSASNARFDQWLKQQDPLRGIRDVGDLMALGTIHGLQLTRDHAMPANNRTLVWEKIDSR